MPPASSTPCRVRASRRAMGSGRLAAESLLAGPGRVAARYCASLAAAHLPYQQITAVAQHALAGRPRAISALSRLLIAAGLSDSFAGGWAVFWNELLDGAPPGRHRTVATALTRIGRTMTARTTAARWLEPALGGSGRGSSAHTPAEGRLI